MLPLIRPGVSGMRGNSIFSGHCGLGVCQKCMALGLAMLSLSQVTKALKLGPVTFPPGQ